ncbi:flippase [Aliiglaciecola sp. 3_MG-2023]|uniref:flippase n=1 Tax=Aliiglaciecola sp. 3_MG-2023 TaxID=3062644 RepID=UPI0026E3C937|nr:flippase [Aliiglaciecola sp. 3_MG-2023]MDO6691863.1 flippase [Aliiglaciecola sp. 3_MG-2023]
MKLKTYFYNANWLIIEKLISLPIGLITSIFLARYLGPEYFGVFSFLISAVYIFLPLMQFGLNSVLTKELVSLTEKTSEILSTALTIRILASLFTFIIGAISAVLFDWIDERHLLLFFLLLFSHTFSAFDIFNFWFESKKNNRPVAIVRVLTLLLFSILKVFVVIKFESLSLLLLVQACELMTGYLLYYFLAKVYQCHFQWQPSYSYGKQLVKKCWWLIFSGIAAALYMKIDQVMLGTIASKSEVGIYSVAVRFSEMSYFLPVAIVTAFFPYLIERKQLSAPAYNNTLAIFLGGLCWLGIAVAIVVTLIATYLIKILYGTEYNASASILAVHVWGGVFVYMRALLSKWLIIEDLLYFSLVTQGTGAIVNIILNLLLIPEYGALGAAWATILSLAFASWFSFFFTKKTVKIAVIMTCAPFMFPKHCLSLINNKK